MIENFEDITEDLSAEELKLVPGFIVGFKKRVGKEHAVTSAQIIAAYYEKGTVITGPRVRAIIHYLRDGWLVPGLVATNKGYYVSRDPDEVKSYINSLGQREAAIGKIRKRMEEYHQQLVTNKS